jgi:hypothetical protein
MDEREAMREIRGIFAGVAPEIRAIFHERPQLYRAIVQADAIALEWLRDNGGGGGDGPGTAT